MLARYDWIDIIPKEVSPTSKDSNLISISRASICDTSFYCINGVHDLEIKPKNLVKGQGLAQMLTESNEKDLDMVCQNEKPNYSPSLQKLEQVECYADIIFYLKHGTCPNHL